ncbi:MAG TPA: hypothetical protein O0W88_03970 [Methanocorpusculum sp.]|nr:hypothetical protein [Methanocorpusculum sp.]
MYHRVALFPCTGLPKTQQLETNPTYRKDSHLKHIYHCDQCKILHSADGRQEYLSILEDRLPIYLQGATQDPGWEHKYHPIERAGSKQKGNQDDIATIRNMNREIVLRNGNYESLISWNNKKTTFFSSHQQASRHKGEKLKEWSDKFFVHR